MSKMAEKGSQPESERLSESPTVKDFVVDDDFVLIELVDDNHVNPNTRPNAVLAPDSNNKTSTIISADGDYEEFVELSIEDYESLGPEVRTQKEKRSLYGIRLFQYSPESEGNIYITNEEL